MIKVAVIGGGLAGLSAAVDLIEAGCDVTLFESAAEIGGRTKSFYHSPQSDLVDNGQHILMGCYENTLRFIKKINAGNKLQYQDRMALQFAEPGGKTHHLKAGSAFYPFNLAQAFWKYDALNIKDKFSIISLIAKLYFGKSVKGLDLSISDWLRSNGQSENAIKSFWEVLAVGALNTSIERASASVFITILKIIFFSGKQASTIILPDKLSEAFCEPARKLILSNGGKINFAERVLSISNNEGSSAKPEIKTNKAYYTSFDFVVSAVPPSSLLKIFQVENILPLNEIEYSPIISINFWLSSNPFDLSFIGLIDSPVHWLFNKGSYVTLVISDAGDFANVDKNEISEICITELEKYFPYFKRDIIIDKFVVKEKRATFISDGKAQKIRKEINTDCGRIKLAGDWTDTGLPGTIESAVKSGMQAAATIIKMN